MADPENLQECQQIMRPCNAQLNEYGISMIALFDYIKTDPIADLAGIRYSDVRNSSLEGMGRRLTITGNHFITSGAEGMMLPDNKQLAGSTIPEANGITPISTEPCKGYFRDKYW